MPNSTHGAIVSGITNMEVIVNGIPDMAKQWHTKPVGAKVCDTCQCDNVRAGVRHRINEDATGYWYEKIIKVCFGTDWSIEVIKPKGTRSV